MKESVSDIILAVMSAIVGVGILFGLAALWVLATPEQAGAETEWEEGQAQLGHQN